MTNQDKHNHRIKDQIKQKMTLEILVISIVNLFRLKRQKSLITSLLLVAPTQKKINKHNRLHLNRSQWFHRNQSKCFLKSQSRWFNKSHLKPNLTYQTFPKRKTNNRMQIITSKKCHLINNKNRVKLRFLNLLSCLPIRRLQWRIQKVNLLMDLRWVKKPKKKMKGIKLKQELLIQIQTIKALDKTVIQQERLSLVFSKRLKILARQNSNNQIIKLFKHKFLSSKILLQNYLILEGEFKQRR